MMVNAVVEAINHETREVRLRRSDGEIIEFVASEEARNLGQVDVDLSKFFDQSSWRPLPQPALL